MLGYYNVLKRLERQVSVGTLILLGTLYWGHLFRKQALAFYALAERLPDSQTALRSQVHRNAAGASFVDIVLIGYAIAIMSYAPAWQHLTPWILCLVPVIWIHYRMATRYARINTPYWNIEDASSQNIVFISYKSQDSELVRAVAEHLYFARRGMRSWRGVGFLG